MIRAPNCSPLRPGDNRGFTLMELLVVIAIMAIISTVAIGGYFGLVRAASYSAAHDTVYNTLALTRQRAVIDGKVTSFVIMNATNYVVVRAAGRITHSSTDYSFDAYSDLKGAVSPDKTKIDIYNLDSDSAKMGERRRVTIKETEISLKDPTVPDSASYDEKNYKVLGYSFDGAGDDFFKAGDRYGFALHSIQSLPRGYIFTDKVGEVRFNSDGSCNDAKTITIVEKIKKKNEIKFLVKTTGEIEDGSLVKK